MGLAGVVSAGIGILVLVLVANGRWNATWAAMLGQSSASSSNGALPIVNGNTNGFSVGDQSATTPGNIMTGSSGASW
jgi:hypothetical protein